MGTLCSWWDLTMQEPNHPLTLHLWDTFSSFCVYVCVCMCVCPVCVYNVCACMRMCVRTHLCVYAHLCMCVWGFRLTYNFWYFTCSDQHIQFVFCLTSSKIHTHSQKTTTENATQCMQCVACVYVCVLDGEGCRVFASRALVLVVVV